MATDPLDLPLDALADRLATGAVRAPDVAAAISARIARRDDTLGAFVWTDPDHLAAQAERCEVRRRAGQPIGALHGVPVALKDTIDTAGIPTENGSAQDAGRVPRRDAWIVARLKAEGALIAGKTATAELAYLSAPATRNPHDPDRSPGGSSSGSAAAVAAGFVPLAVGTQTVGSVIRPAAFCGVTGYKPSFGAIPRTGVLSQSPSLDTMGVFAATPRDAARIAEVLFGHDPADRATTPRPHPRLLRRAMDGPGVAPVFALVQPPGWDRADADTLAAFAEMRDALGDQAFEVPLPAIFEEAFTHRERINLAEMAHAYRRYAARPEALSDVLREAIERGAAIPARDYLAACDWRAVLSAGLTEILRRADAILCPSALGPAPPMGSTGDSIFNGLWTLCGLPAVSVPILRSHDDLPMGVQVISGRDDDGRCLAAAQWLFDWALEDAS